MRNFTVSFFSVLVILFLFSIILPAMGYTLAPLSGATQLQNQSDTVQTPSVVIAPDSPLYAIERAMEEMQLGFAFKHKVKAQLLVKFTQERAAEAAIMINKKKTALAAQAVSDMVNNLLTLEEMKEYLSQETAATVNSSIIQIKKSSALAVAQVVKNSNPDVVQNYIRANKDYYDAITQLEVARTDYEAAVATKQVSAIQDASEKLEQVKERVNVSIDNSQSNW